MRIAERHIGCGGIIIEDFDPNQGHFLRCNACWECWSVASVEPGVEIAVNEAEFARQTGSALAGIIDIDDEREEL